MTFQQACDLIRSEGLHINLSVNDSALVYFRWIDCDEIVAFADVCLLSRSRTTGRWRFSCSGPGYSDYVRPSTLEDTVAFVLKVHRKLQSDPSLGIADAFLDVTEPEYATPVRVLEE